EPAVNCWVIVGVRTDTRGSTANPIPVPESAIVCGVPGALSEMETDDERGPTVVGANVMLIVQAPAGSSVFPQLFASAKSPTLPAEIEILLIVRDTPPTFVTVTDSGLLVTPV